MPAMARSVVTPATSVTAPRTMQLAWAASTLALLVVAPRAAALRPSLPRASLPSTSRRRRIPPPASLLPMVLRIGRSRQTGTARLQQLRSRRSPKHLPSRFPRSRLPRLRPLPRPMHLRRARRKMSRRYPPVSPPYRSRYRIRVQERGRPSRSRRNSLNRRSHPNPRSYRTQRRHRRPRPGRPRSPALL